MEVELVKKGDPVGRLALRVEDDFWRAYYAKPDTMQDAILIGSLHMALARDEILKAAFMDLMKKSITFMLLEAAETSVVWPNPPQVAPAHERRRR
jgi:hypothetical protein